MAIQKGASTPKKGMNRSSGIFEVTEAEYTFAFNANFNDAHGSGQVNLQNEPSNIYCSGFKQDYKVVGYKYHMSKDKVYFFLTNPITGYSEIGYMSTIHNPENLEALSEECGCNIKVILENPLEDSPRVSTCTYHTIISDFCDITESTSKCLAFDINSPIHESNIHIKEEITGTTIYWTDGNTPRYIQLDQLSRYIQNVDSCTGEVVDTCLKCDELRIFPLYDRMCIKTRTIQAGGNLRAGVYEIVAAYCDFNGNQLTDYYSKTNLTPIHNPNNNILDQTNLDYLTNLAIGLDVSDLDENYEYYKIAVIYKSGLDATMSYYDYGVYPISNKRVSITSLVDKTKITLEDIVSRRATYTKARGLSEGNGYLFQYGLEAQVELNLQPVINLAGGFVKWATVEAKEDLYNNGADVSNYLSYMRDEVEPLSIKFYMDGGYETPNYVFIPRPPTSTEIQVLGTQEFPIDSNTESINSEIFDCADNIRDKRWQYENTAKVEGRCYVDGGASSGTVIKEKTTKCIVENQIGGVAEFGNISSGSIDGIDTDDIVAYINANLSNIKISVDPKWIDIQNVLDNPSNYIGSCTPPEEDNCEPWEEFSAEMLAFSVDTQEVVNSYVPFPDQTRIHQPNLCNVFVEPIEQDTVFIANYMFPGSSVLKRNGGFSNVTCGAATTIPLYVSPMLDNSFHLQTKGTITGLASLQTAYSSSAISSGYSGKVHTNALWYEVNLTEPLTVVELSNNINPASDDVTGNSIRVTVFDGCSLTDEASYSRIITDVTSTGDINKYLELLLVDFIGSVAKIAIDSPYVSETIVGITILDSGFTGLTINSHTYSIAYGGSATVTATNFVTAHAASILSVEGMNVTSDGPTILISTTTVGASNISVTGSAAGYNRSDKSIHRLTPPSGCINIFKREVEATMKLNFTNLTFAKNITYKTECTYEIPLLLNCEPIPYEFGTFSYWESDLKYPCNKELYDSSELSIRPVDLPDGIRSDFEVMYTSGVDGIGQYIMLPDTNFRDKPIRHYKFPCSNISPFIPTNDKTEEGLIYPIGFSIDNEMIRAFLDIAVKNNLISVDERTRIKKYEVFRGDRSVDKSVVAKGILFDMYEYEETNGESVLYPNYPLNSLGADSPNRNNAHPYGSNRNSYFTFHSPDTSYYKPTIPGELSVEGYLLGDSETYFDIVEDHPTYVILSKKGYNLATNLAIAEIAFETLMKTMDYSMSSAGAGTVPGIALTSVVLVTAITALVEGAFKVGKIRYQWLETFRNLGHPENFAYYSTTVGNYRKILKNNELGSRLRRIDSSTYLKEGRWEVAEEVTASKVNVNNVDRSDSIFIGLGAEDSHSIIYPTVYKNWDNYDVDAAQSSRKLWDGVGTSPKLAGSSGSPYVALKQYLPSQYGSISSINWLTTGHCGNVDLDNGCDTIFGGDTYISRFSPKRKFPFFLNNAFGQAPLTPFKYSDYFNIKPIGDDGKYYLDYLIDTDEGGVSFGGFTFPTNKSVFNFYPQPFGIEEDGIYIKPPAKFFLFSYGFPNFIVESVFNGHYRYAKREPHEDFYPNIKDTIKFTQEKNVSIKEPNAYFYNFVYSSLPSRMGYRMLPEDYSREMYDKLSNLTNTVIYSGQDMSENSLVDPWLNYKPLDAYQFPTTYGRLIDIDGIESEQMLGRFEHGITIFGAIDVFRDKLTSEVVNLGTGGIFSGRNINFNKTDLGYGGTQSVAKVSCEFGHFWADAKRGEVFKLEPNGQGLAQITEGMEEWFKEHLPFKILKDFPAISLNELDNPLKGLGITMAWDARSKRVFLTKLDYQRIKGSGVVYRLGRFYAPDPNNVQGEIEVFLQDEDYFINCSFTIAYSPLTQSWISYYGFHPNYYIGYEGYFQTGINYSKDEQEIGIWSHLPFLSSYQVFYGKLQPFIIEYAIPGKGSRTTLQDIRYALDVRKYYNKYDISDVKDIGYNKAFIYNNYQNTGQLNLIPRKVNNLAQEMTYPKHNPTSIDILQTEEIGMYTFNHLYNAIRVDGGGIPIWLNDANEIHKTLNQSLLNMRSQYKDRLQGDYFIVRLQQDIESRYKMIHRFSIDKRDYR